jgi:hypothetical protein
VGTPEEPRKQYDTFDAPDDRTDPWRGRSLPLVLGALAVIALVVILYLIL